MVHRSLDRWDQVFCPYDPCVGTILATRSACMTDVALATLMENTSCMCFVSVFTHGITFINSRFHTSLRAEPRIPEWTHAPRSLTPDLTPLCAQSLPFPSGPKAAGPMAVGIVAFFGLAFSLPFISAAFSINSKGLKASW